ncbi:hypothetical protein HX813_28700 [Pseudomonas yamanorum]|uniref:hypothetical protein n=1 Tax=Pseudomonas yamanorum TaxID=515393 RepID=UPI0015A1AE14|nr:hypothetical protein [Pseudomonas yamanorum]NVZ92214.1 hypothetical protein [Pseudomonas yamanorum]
MNYLEEEIDEALITLGIEGIKLNSSQISSLITSLIERFFKTKQKTLDPNYLNVKTEQHNPNFWKEIQDLIHSDRLILIVFDSAHRAWEIGGAKSLALILSETTGYPFWITDRDLTFLVHMDDHDCISWA